MSQEFQKEIKSIDGRPYLVHIKMYHNSDGEVKAAYCVTRNTISYSKYYFYSILWFQL